MTSIIRRVTQAIARNETEIVCECRRCGTSLDRDDEACSTCESGEVVEYRID